MKRIPFNGVKKAMCLLSKRETSPKGIVTLAIESNAREQPTKQVPSIPAFLFLPRTTPVGANTILPSLQVSCGKNPHVKWRLRLHPTPKTLGTIIVHVEVM